MFEQAIQASDALAKAPGRLLPALCACSACQTFKMITGPVLGVCAVCGGELTVLSGDKPVSDRAQDIRLPPQAAA